MTKQEEIYWKEFGLNLKYQLNDFEIKEFMHIGYQIENLTLFSLMIPKNIFKQK